MARRGMSGYRSPSGGEGAYGILGGKDAILVGGDAADKGGIKVRLLLRSYEDLVIADEHYIPGGSKLCTQDAWGECEYCDNTDSRASQYIAIPVIHYEKGGKSFKTFWVTASLVNDIRTYFEVAEEKGYKGGISRYIFNIRRTGRKAATRYHFVVAEENKKLSDMEKDALKNIPDYVDLLTPSRENDNDEDEEEEKPKKNKKAKKSKKSSKKVVDDVEDDEEEEENEEEEEDDEWDDDEEEDEEDEEEDEEDEDDD